MNNFSKLIVYISNIPLCWLSKLIHKEDNVWIFGAWYGEKYTDNSKYLFEYINRYHKEIEAIWVTDSNEVLRLVKKKGFTIYKKYSLKAIKYGLKAKFSIFSHSNASDCMMFLNNKKTKLVQLWHGTPLKKIVYDDIYGLRKKNVKLKEFVFPMIKEKHDFIISCSKEDKGNFVTAFDNNNVFITGYPRNDILEKKQSSVFKNVLYMPTHRDGGKTDIVQLLFNDLEVLNRKLKDLDVLLSIKLHYCHLMGQKKNQEFSNIRMLFDNDILQDVYSVLNNYDMLITDYSSIFFDFLLTEKPIIFAPFDIDDYVNNDRQFYYDYNKVTPGPKCYDWINVLNWVEKFKHDTNLFSSERKLIKERFHDFIDSNSCKRVYDAIKKIK